MSNGNANGNSGTKHPVFQTIVAPGLVAAILAVGAWVWNLELTNNAQDVQLGKHEERIRGHDTNYSRIETKLDRLIELLRSNN